MNLVAFDERDRPFFPVLVVVAVALAAAVLSALVTVAVRSALDHPRGPHGKSARATGCAAAVRLADQALTDARQVQSDIQQHAEVMNSLLAGQITPNQALDRGMPPLVAATQRTSRFDQEVEVYRSAAATCR